MERVIAGKNFEFTGTVESFGSNGEGIVREGETVFFAPFTVVGEKVKFKALKVKGRIGYAKALEILTPADERVRPRCPAFTKCGGCQLQHLRYGAQLKLKSKTVQDALRKIAGIRTEVPLTAKSEFQYEYRNKLQLPVGIDAQGNTVIGFYAERSHRIVPVNGCPIHPCWAGDIISVFKQYIEKSGARGFDETKRTGTLRHIVVRDVEGAFIVTAVTYGNELPKKELLIQLLREKFSRFSLWQNINGEDTNTVFGDEFRLLFGEGKYSASECGIRFEAGPNTFIQVNAGVCRKLYDRTVRFASQSGAEIGTRSGAGLRQASGGSQRLSSLRVLSRSNRRWIPSSLARLVLPTSSAPTEGWRIWFIMRLTATRWVRVVSIMYSWAFSGSPIWSRPRITWSLFINSWV